MAAGAQRLETDAGGPSQDLQNEVRDLLAAAATGLLEQCPSEYSFSNLYLFRRVHDYRFLPGARPCISGVTYDGSSHLFPLFDLATLDPREARGLLDGHDCFFPISEATVRRLDSRSYTWDESRDDADYLYRGSNFRSYPGAGLRGKRAQMARFAASGAVRALPYGRELKAEALAVLTSWMQEKEKNPGEADELPCEEALEYASALRLEGFVYFVGQQPAGFVLGEEMQPGTCVVRFAKGLHEFDGIYPFMFNHVARNFPGPPEWLNFEQDMGLQNFRRSKQSYLPHSLVRKYRVEPVDLF